MNIDEQIYEVSRQLNFVNDNALTLAYIGRFCPMHLGHQAMIGGMIHAAKVNHLLLIGSCNQPLSYRNLFGFADRLSFIKTVYPDANVVGLPDFKDDNASWFTQLDCLIRLAGAEPSDVVFIGGCEEDVEWFGQFDRKVAIVNRFEGITTNISGTEIRDHLIEKRYEKLDGLLDRRIVPQVIEKFAPQWEKLRKQ